MVLSDLSISGKDRTGAGLAHTAFIMSLLSIFMIITPDSCTPVTFTTRSFPLNPDLRPPPSTAEGLRCSLKADVNLQQPQFGI